jgi:hypothetical protein
VAQGLIETEPDAKYQEARGRVEGQDQVKAAFDLDEDAVGLIGEQVDIEGGHNGFFSWLVVISCRAVHHSSDSCTKVCERSAAEMIQKRSSPAP